MQGKLKKLKKEIGKGEFELLTIGRSESQQEIDTRIDLLDDESRKKERSVGIHELERDVDQNYGDWAKCCRVMNIWILTKFRKFWGKMRRVRGTTPQRRRERVGISRIRIRFKR